MPNHPKFNMAGITRMDVGLLNPNGIPMGLAGSLAAGEDSGLYRIDGVRTADLSFGQPDLVNIVGDARFRGVYMFPPAAAPTGNLEGAVYDMDLVAALEQVNKVTRGPLSMVVAGGSEKEYPDVCAIFTGSAKSETAGYLGKKIYWGYIAPVMSLAVLGHSAMTQREAVQANMFMAVSMADKYPWGEAFVLEGAGSEGTLEGILIPWTAPYPLAIHTFVGDGVTADVVLDHTPAGADDAAEQVVFAYDYTNGAELTTTTDFTVVTATKTLTFAVGAVPAAGEVVVIYYMYVPGT
jgi:hypothetical protein